MSAKKSERVSYKIYICTKQKKKSELIDKHLYNNFYINVVK